MCGSNGIFLVASSQPAVSLCVTLSPVCVIGLWGSIPSSSHTSGRTELLGHLQEEFRGWSVLPVTLSPCVNHFILTYMPCLWLPWLVLVCLSWHQGCPRWVVIDFKTKKPYPWWSLPLLPFTGGLDLAIEGPSKAEISCIDNKDGTCTVTYLPTLPGDYSILVKYNDKHIPGSPFTAKITGRVAWLPGGSASIRTSPLRPRAAG